MATSAEQVQNFLIQLRNNPTILDKYHPDVVRHWKEQAGIVDAKIQSQATSVRISNRGLGISIGIDENSNLDQVVDFAFRLQIMRSNGVVNQDFWKLGAESIKEWLSAHDSNWTSFLESMKAQVSA
jgi:hypothetical protein